MKLAPQLISNRNLYFITLLCSLLLHCNGIEIAPKDSATEATYNYCNSKEGMDLAPVSTSSGKYRLVDISYNFGSSPFQPACYGPTDFKKDMVLDLAVSSDEKTELAYQGRHIDLKYSCVGTDYFRTKKQVEYYSTLDLRSLNTPKNHQGDVFIFGELGEVKGAEGKQIKIIEHWEYRADSKCHDGWFGTSGGDCFGIFKNTSITRFPENVAIPFDQLDNQSYRWIGKVSSDGGACYSRYELIFEKVED